MYLQKSTYEVILNFEFSVIIDLIIKLKAFLRMCNLLVVKTHGGAGELICSI